MTQIHQSPSLVSRFFGLRFGFLPARLRALSPVLVLVVLAGGAFLALGHKGSVVVEDKGDGLKRVQIVTVKTSAVTQPRSLVGTMRARVESDLGFRVGGKLAERRVQAGQSVKAGDVLAVLDASDFRLSREAAEAEVRAAKSSANQAQLDFDRTATLRARGFATAQAEDKLRATLDEAKGRLIRAAKQVEIAANNQGYAELKSDADGIVSATLAEPGQVVAAGQAIVRLARNGEREALVAVPEQDLAFVREAQASATLWSAPGKVHPAHLRELSPNADSATRTFAARFTVEGLAPDAPLGMTVTLALTKREPTQGIRVPLSALLNEGGGAEVFVLSGEGGELARKKVNLIGYDGRDALIASGLSDGERVVTLGVHTLRAGEKVVALPEAPQG